MRAIVLEIPGKPLRETELPEPEPGPGQVRVRVEACGVCRTDLHIVDGELREPKLPLVLGHQIVGVVDAVGDGVELAAGERVGVPWLGWTDGDCRFCRSGRENLCLRARFTGYHLDGGYAETAVADARYCFRLPDDQPALQLAPLLCAGLIGYRSLRLAGDGERLGLYGFGASAHIVAQVARHQGRRVFAFTRAGDDESQVLARSLGAEWVGASDELPPEPLDAAIVFAPAGEIVPAALKALKKGGLLVLGGIHMSAIPSFNYDLLYQERMMRSVTNNTRQDGEDFLRVAAEIPIQTRVRIFPLRDANRALNALKNDAIPGAAVLRVSE